MLNERKSSFKFTCLGSVEAAKDWGDLWQVSRRAGRCLRTEPACEDAESFGLVCALTAVNKAGSDCWQPAPLFTGVGEARWSGGGIPSRRTGGAHRVMGLPCGQHWAVPHIL